MDKTGTFYNFAMLAKVEPILPTPSPLSYFFWGGGGEEVVATMDDKVQVC